MSPCSGRPGLLSEDRWRKTVTIVLLSPRDLPSILRPLPAVPPRPPEKEMGRPKIGSLLLLVLPLSAHAQDFADFVENNRLAEARVLPFIRQLNSDAFEDRQ